MVVGHDAIVRPLRKTALDQLAHRVLTVTYYVNERNPCKSAILCTINRAPPKTGIWMSSRFELMPRTGNEDQHALFVCAGNSSANFV